METLLLRDGNIFPDEKTLRESLGDLYEVYENFLSNITKEPLSLEPSWNYYKDGKSWLCKVSYKKKTVFWLSVWDDCFIAGFYFTEKSKPAIEQLEIADSIKKSFFSAESIGKLIPMTIKISQLSQLTDLYKIIVFKKSLK